MNKTVKLVLITSLILAGIYALTLIPPAYTPPPHNEVAVHNYELAVDYFNKKEFVKAIGHFAKIQPDDTLYKNAQAAIDHCHNLIAAEMILEQKRNEKTWQEKFVKEYEAYRPDTKLSIKGSTLYIDAPEHTEDLNLYASMFALQFQQAHYRNTDIARVHVHVRLNNKVVKVLSAGMSGLEEGK